MATPVLQSQQYPPGQSGQQQEFQQYSQSFNNQQDLARSSPEPPTPFQSSGLQHQPSVSVQASSATPQMSQQHEYQHHQIPSMASVQSPSSTFSPPPYYEPTQDQSTKVDDSSFAFRTPDPFYKKATRYTSQRFQLLLDASAPHWAARWTFSLVILLVFMARIVIAQGWYVICYGLSIYYLNLFIGFLSPKIDPAFAESDDYEDSSSSGPMLPTRANDEFRPFIRRLPEFKFWLSATNATLISLFLSMFEIFDLPVFWPILLLYFIILFISTMRQQIRHMIKYGYVPWDKGKKKYGRTAGSNDEDTLFSSNI